MGDGSSDEIQESSDTAMPESEFKGARLVKPKISPAMAKPSAASWIKPQESLRASLAASPPGHISCGAWHHSVALYGPTPSGLAAGCKRCTTSRCVKDTVSLNSLEA